MPLNVDEDDAADDDDTAGVEKVQTKLFSFQQPVDSTGETLPEFLMNALVGKLETISHDSCPFKEYINLKQNAWGIEAESQYLIVRQCYTDLAEWLHSHFKQWKQGALQARTITGTAGIGKTMFALYLARLLFETSNYVLLYWGDKFWAFANKPSPNFLSKNCVAPDGTKIYFTLGNADDDRLALNRLLKSELFFKIRDSAKKALEWLDLAEGRIAYIASSGQEEFLGTFIGKSGVPPIISLKFTDLWSDLECVWSVKLGLLKLKVVQQQQQQPLRDSSNSNLDIQYVLEGYRRYGGSVRNVLGFARHLKRLNINAEEIMTHPLSAETTTAVRCIVDYQAIYQRERAKAKAMVFHRSPVRGMDAYGYRVHFASTFLGQLVTKSTDYDKVRMLNTVVAALSLSPNKQSAYGTLYEEEFHRVMMDIPSEQTPSTIRTLQCLGTYDPSSKKVTGMVPKANITLDFVRADVVHFPGNSLANVQLEGTERWKSTYFHPLASNFPTHDAFIVCDASCFFEVAKDAKLTKQARQQLEDKLAKSIVLVGLQMTVSGSDDVEDKPSHTIVGQHLVDHLEDFKRIAQQYQADINVLDDVVTVFVSPSESCRKMDFMTVQTKDKTPLQNAIANFKGTAVQYYTVYEVQCIADLMSPDDN